MIARCWGSGCGWETRGADVVRLTAEAELHREREHDWVSVGKCHRLELDETELADVGRALLELKLEMKALGAVRNRGLTYSP